MAFGGFAKTNGGLEALARTQLGEKLEFTSVQLGDGRYNGSFRPLTALLNPLLIVQREKIFVARDGASVILTCDLSTYQQDTELRYREIGVFVTIGGQTLLYNYDNAGADTESIPARGAAYGKTHRLRFYFALDETANVVLSEGNPLYISSAELLAVAERVDGHTADTGNPHRVTAAQVGLGKVSNTADMDKPVSTAQKAALDAHSTSKANPHGVTAAQVGLDKVNNTADADKPVSTAQKAALDTHANNKANPHGVTAAQVGLGSVNNTTDASKSVAYADRAGTADSAWAAYSADVLGGYAASNYPRLNIQNSFSVMNYFPAGISVSGANIINPSQITFTGALNEYNISRNGTQLQHRFSTAAFLNNAGAYSPVYASAFTVNSSMAGKDIINETVPETLLNALLEADVFQFAYKTKNLVTPEVLQTAYNADFMDESVAHLFEIEPLAYRILDLETHYYTEEAAELEAELPDIPILKDGAAQHAQRVLTIAKAVGETDPKKIAEAAFIAEQIFTGCSAEKMAKIYPACVSFDTETGKPVGIDYSKLAAPLLVLIQMLYKRVAILEQNDSENENRMRAMETEMQTMKKQLYDFETRLLHLEKNSN